MGIEIARVDETGIYGFFGEYRYLSNFHICSVVVNGRLFPSSEHAYMYGKLTDEEQEKVSPVTYRSQYDDIILLSCEEVKAWGRTVDLRPDWDDIKVKVMEEALYSKFTLNEDLKQKLIGTGDLYLEESNWWSDFWWGVCNGVGQNQLGKSLMKIRNEIKWV